MHADDALALASYQSEPDYLRHYPSQPDAGAIVAAAIEWAAAKPRVNYQFAVTLRDSQRVIGCGGLRQAGYPAGTAELGIEIAPSAWRRGYANEALLALVEFARTLELTTLTAVTRRSNEPAQALIERLAFVYEHADGDDLRYSRAV